MNVFKAIFIAILRTCWGDLGEIGGDLEEHFGGKVLKDAILH